MGKIKIPRGFEVDAKHRMNKGTNTKSSRMCRRKNPFALALLVVMAATLLTLAFLPQPALAETQTRILNNASNSFPMFSNAEYVNFTIGDDTIILTLDTNASYDGVCNLSNITGTNISAAGSFAELNYSSVTYQTGEYDQKWESAPYFNSTTNRLHLFSGSGIVTAFKLTMEENSTSVNKTIPKVVGVGSAAGQFLIETTAEGKNSTYNLLDANMRGVGYMDSYVQYAPDTSYENTTFIPTFLDCEKLELQTISLIEPGISSILTTLADVLGIASGAEPVPEVSHEWTSELQLDVEYFPTTYRNHSYNQTWNVTPYFNSTTNRLHLFSGSGIVTAFKLTMEENSTSVNKTIPKVVGVGSAAGQFLIETTAEGKNSTYNLLDANMRGVGYMDSYVQYAPDTSYENTTFIPTFLDCEKLELQTISLIEPGISSILTTLADVLGIASGAECLMFNDIPLDNVAINETFDLEYHPVNISCDMFDECWSVKPVQYDDILVILRGTGTMTKLNFTFNDSTTALPKIISYGYLRGDYNLSANILPHYMNVIANGTNVSAMDESGQGGFGITFAVPIITAFAPPSPVNDTVCTWRTFSVTVNQTVNVSWYLNNSLLHTNVSTKEANCTLHAEFVDDNNVSAVATNANGTDMQTWVWNVVPTTVTIPTATGTGNVTINTSSGYFCNETAALGAADFPILPDSAVTFHHGFFNLTICGLNTYNPENVTINFTFPTAIPTNAEFWKYNSSNGTWYPYPFDSNDGDNVISITITDNGAGDHNPALGVINDPNGIGWEAPAQVPALTPIGIAALVGLLSIIATSVIVRKRKKG
ncbi:MAG: hypothetical protein AEth_00101 [Candidatus Argoarchaeum ethanivorans]|uniref:Uncharacterized protein n=1 Tax=Candidatus Argoarchaeum ethanivorans TaxID=2608793 RepID=A0A8B3SAT5_9EURY|nr:MAG: hypothetical protein AEth_00101 [Candidatus Argoarchaeum ethanivorans]